MFYLVKAPKRIIKHICRKIRTGICKDIPFGFGSDAILEGCYLVVIDYFGFYVLEIIK